MTGAIPSCVGRLRDLVDLDFSKNSLTGTIPASFGELDQLTAVRLNSNMLTGSLSCVGRLTSLEFLIVDHNEFEGTLPNLTNLTNLRALIVHENALQGRLPEVWPSNLVATVAHANLLSCEVPSNGPTEGLICLVAGNLLEISFEAPSWFQRDMLSDSSFVVRPAFLVLALPLFQILFCTLWLWWSSGLLHGVMQFWNFCIGRYEIAIPLVAKNLLNICSSICLVGMVQGCLTFNSRRYECGEPLSTTGLCYLQGLSCTTAVVLWVLATPIIGRWIKLLPTVPLNVSDVSIIHHWTAVVSIFACSLPDLGYVLLCCVPVTGIFMYVRAFLLPCASVCSGFLQPLLMTQAYGGRVLKHYLALPGLLSWILPVVVILIFADNCGGYWKSFYGPCIDRQSPFDILDKVVPVWWMPRILSKENICDGRWEHPHRCTMEVMCVLTWVWVAFFVCSLWVIRPVCQFLMSWRVSD